MQVLMDAELAVEMGVPIYAVVALTSTASDKNGRSIPAPGQGILTTCRESHSVAAASESASASPMLDLGFRRSNLQDELATVQAWEVTQLAAGHDSAFIGRMADRKRAAARDTWGQGFYKDDPHIAPLRGALAVWGLGVDDLAVASFHGTSTKLNDKNESAVVNRQMEHLGRTPGNVLFVIAQKALTGHPKGAAAAWMANGLIQTMLSGTVPGNRNLDNVGPELRANGFLFYPNRAIQVPQQIKAAFLKSFGFGQAGAECVVVHPDLLLSALSGAAFDAYRSARCRREQTTYRYMQGVFSGKHSLVQVKAAPPYTKEQEQNVYLDPLARAAYDPAQRSWAFGPRYSRPALPAHLRTDAAAAGPAPPRAAPAAPESAWAEQRLHVSAQMRLQVTLEENAAGIRGAAGALEKGVGVDVEPVATFENPREKLEFIARNFTAAEIEHCFAAASPADSFTGRWAAKEAVVKAMSSASPQTRSLWQGSSASLIDIEIVQGASNAPVVVLHGHAKAVFSALGLTVVKVSISHSAAVAVAQALAM
jgi:fatty acid synthase subunit beta